MTALKSPSVPPFSKGEVLLQGSNASLEKRGRGDFGRNEAENMCNINWH